MTTTFESLGLSGKILRGVSEAGYTTPTPVQAATVPVAIEGKDLTGCAQTGTGKTAAFVLPLLHRLATSSAGKKGTSKTRRPVRGLVITPTRELASQVDQSARTYGRFTGLRSIAIFGGVSMDPQYRAFHRGVDIVIATPGRLLDHINRGSIDLSRVEMLILDEADRMFDMGFINDIRKIVAAVPQERQTLLFSATMPKAVAELAQSIQTNPEFIEVGKRRNPADTVTQHIYPVAQSKKMDLLLHILQSEDTESVLVFSRTKHRADRIAQRLEQRKISAQAIHSNRTQNQRQRTLAGFKRGDFQVLVATDIAARGIDVDGISHVINFDTPNQAEDYIHRIGRTGRADTTGDALTFVSSDEESYLRSIERFTGKRFERKNYPGFSGGEERRAPRREDEGRPERPRKPKGPRKETRQPRFADETSAQYARKPKAPRKDDRREAQGEEGIGSERPRRTQGARNSSKSFQPSRGKKNYRKSFGKHTKQK